MSLRPTSGVRYALERTLIDAARVTYEGHAHRPDDAIALRVHVALPGGAVTAEVVAPEPHPELTKQVAALVRAATKAEVAAGQALPRKIVRWRG
ncbi:MAG: hypothetical protein R3B70_40445 [Polyangiaceae bacterium]